MLSFKQFYSLVESGRQFYGVYDHSYLLEGLNKAQKKIVDQWPKTGEAERISGHVIPPGQDRISIPLEHPEENEIAQPHPDVLSHLEKHGYKIADYKAGLATDQYGRNVKIGKALQRTAAPKETFDKFTQDPSRKGAKAVSSGLHVVVSRHPHDVAAMSTGQGWTSCMNMKGGENCHYLQPEVEAGTHVAYLAHESDPHAEHPLARIALKPFHDRNETILRPEGVTYGDADNAFAHTVRKWTEKHFPMRPNGEYERDVRTYNDDGITRILPFEKMVSHEDPELRGQAFDTHRDKITPEHIEKATDPAQESEPFVRSRAISHPRATSNQIMRALSDRNAGVRRAAIQNPNARSEHLMKALDDNDLKVRETAISHPNIAPEHISKAITDQFQSLVMKAISSKKVSSQNISDALEPNIHPWVREAAIEHPKATPEHITKALNDTERDVRLTALKHPKANRDHALMAMANPDKKTAEAGARLLKKFDSQ